MSRLPIAPRRDTHGRPISVSGRVRRPRVGAALGVLAVLALGGCPDPEAKFNEFVDHTKDDRDFMTPDMPPPPDLGPMLPDVSGTFLLAVSTSIAPDLPMQFIITNTMTIDMMGNATLDVSMQPLALMQGHVLTPRTPFGEPTEFTDVPITEGRFDIDAGTLMVAGAANPVTGSDIVVELLLKGTIINADFYCGELVGELIEPLQAELMNSTFAAVRLADPEVLPTDVTINCNQDTVTGK